MPRPRPRGQRDDGRRQGAQVSALSTQQQRDYERDGYLFPLAVLTADEVDRYRGEYERLEPRLGRTTTPRHGQTHLHFRWAYDLATHPRILDVVEDLIGPDLLVHTTTLFCKQPRNPAHVAWHQDAHNWGLDAPRLVSAWVALTESTPENGCMRVLPGTHRERLEHESRPDRASMLPSGLTVAGAVDETSAVDFTLGPGQISLHHADLVHGSQGNRSDGKRIGFAIRYVSPSVKQQRAHHAVVLARGDDAHGHYDLLDTPPAADFEQALAAHDAFWRRIAERGDRPDLALTSDP